MYKKVEGFLQNDVKKVSLSALTKVYLFSNIDHRRWSKRCTPLGVPTFKKSVKVKKVSLNAFFLKEVFFVTGLKYTPVYENQQKEKKTIYWRLLYSVA